MLGLSENGERWWIKLNKTVSFSEFIGRILKEWKTSHTANEHWRPYYLHCDYCDIKYDFIGRMENFENDLKFIAQKTHIALHNLPSKALLVHPSGGGQRYSSPQKMTKMDKEM